MGINNVLKKNETTDANLHGPVSLTSSLQRRTQISMINPLLNFNKKIGITDDFSPTAYNFNQNFDENGYVFDGIKVEVIFLSNSSYFLLISSKISC